MAKRQRITPEAILEIGHNSFFYYAQILNAKGCAFFNIRYEKPLEDISILNDQEVLFVLRVYDDVITKGRWGKVGKIEIRDSLKIEPNKFIQDSINPNRIEIYNPNTGEITPSTKEEVEGLECAAVWAANHVEDRLEDYFLGKKNVWLEQLMIK